MSIKKRSMVCTVLLLAMFFAMCIPAMAATYNQVISLPANKAWTTAGSDARSGAYSYVKVRNHSVYPSSGADFFGLIRCKITNESGTLLCNDNYYTLDEGASTYTQISIREGYLNTEDVYFNFCGNTNSAAKAVVSYYAP